MLMQDTVGAMARTADDLILLDSIIRNSPANSTGNGAVYPAVQCAAPMNDSMTSLKGVRFGLPSTFGWVTAGISQEVSTDTDILIMAVMPHLLPLECARGHAAWQKVSGPAPLCTSDGMCSAATDRPAASRHCHCRIQCLGSLAWHACCMDLDATAMVLHPLLCIR